MWYHLVYLGRDEKHVGGAAGNAEKSFACMVCTFLTPVVFAAPLLVFCLLICLFFPQRFPRDQRRAQVRDVGDRDAAFPADGEEHRLLLGGYGRRECRTSAVRCARCFECLDADRAFAFEGALLPLASLLMHT